MYKIKFLSNGIRNTSVVNYIKNIKIISLKRKVKRDLNRLKKEGLSIGAPIVKRMLCRKGLYKFRVKDHRILFMIEKDEIIILHIFQKNTQKTPEKDKIIGMRNMDIALSEEAIFVV